ncbi:MAG: ThiS family protein [Desulfobacteraceae bacterium 4572_130]|nr:MAG: ThiS family protein [Desulfobacteraceae bacterium 4572_130]
MDITINIPITHRAYTNGEKTVRLSGKTVNEVLEKLVQIYPDINNKLFNNKNELHKTIEIYVNMKSAYPNELEKEIKNGDEIQILTVLAGG